MKSAAGVRPSKQAKTDETDHISLLPDGILSKVITRLPIKDAARTTALSRRWRPLWRASPLNLDDAHLPRWSWQHISKILSEHRGPARRLSLRSIVRQDSIADLAEWLRSPALDGLEVIHLDYRYDLLLPPFALLRFAPTLRFARFGGCRFPEDLSPALAFPRLNRLILAHVGVSENALHGLLSACTALTVLMLEWCSGFDRLVIDSPTLRSFGMCADGYVSELVVEYAPRLERLIAFDHLDIQVISAPRLQSVAMLDSDKTALHCGTMASRGIAGGSLAMLMCSVKLLILDTFGPDLDAVLDFIKCFPCLKKTHIMSYLEVDLKMKNVCLLNPQDPIRCLNLTLKEIVLKGYEGEDLDVNFAKFFVLNAKVLEVMEIGVQDTEKVNKKWKADQRRRLRLDCRASRNARFVFGDAYPFTTFACSSHVHILTMADPVGSSCGVCGHVD